MNRLENYINTAEATGQQVERLYMESLAKMEAQMVHRFLDWKASVGLPSHAPTLAKWLEI